MAQIAYWAYGDGEQTTWTLPGTPYGLVQVYLNGALIDPTNYTVSGNQITFNYVALPSEEWAVVFNPYPEVSPIVAGGTAALIQVSEVVNDPDLAQPFTINRSSGVWNNGVWQSTTTAVQGYGVIANPTVRELEMIPEGDLVKGAMVFWSAQPIYGTHGTQGVGGSSDILIWRGNNYRVLNVTQYQDYGFYRAIAVRMKAD
jgi:hypothetical protein